MWIIIHVISIMAGYGLLALTSLGGVLYLGQDRALRAKKMGPVFRRLPSLSRLDSLNQASLLAGFLLMTIGLISGAVYAQMTLGSYWRWDPKEVWALITWLLYAALLHTRLVQGWRGPAGGLAVGHRPSPPWSSPSWGRGCSCPATIASAPWPDPWEGPGREALPGRPEPQDRAPGGARMPGSASRGPARDPAQCVALPGCARR